MKLTKLFLFFVLLSMSISSLAQETEAYLCRVLDIKSNDPIVYATIKFENRNYGVIADINGGFRLPITTSFITISSIGYETLRIQTNTLDFNIVNRVYLKPKVEALDAVFLNAKKKRNLLILQLKKLLQLL